METGRLSRRAIIGTALSVAALALAPSAVHADVNGTSSLQIPSPVTVGQTGIPASLTLTNANTFGSVADTNQICGQGAGGAGECDFSGAEIFSPLGIFKFSAGVGRTGTACAGTTWPNNKVSNQEEWDLSSTAQVLLPGAGSQCTIDFTFDVLSFGSGDASVSSGPLPLTKQVEVETTHIQCTPVPCGGMSAHFGPHTFKEVILNLPKCAGAAPTQVGTVGPDKLIGTRRRDVILALDGNDTIKGLGGSDVICGSDGKDSISGGDGNDTLLGGGGKDRLRGGADDDRCTGGKANDSGSCEVEKSV